MSHTITRKTAAELVPGDVFTEDGPDLTAGGTGFPYLCTDAPKRLGVVGPAARIVRVFGLRYDRAGHLPDGTLEFGILAHWSFDLDLDTPVTVHRTGALRRSEVHPQEPLPIKDRVGQLRRAWTSEVRRTSHLLRFGPGRQLGSIALRRALCKATQHGVPAPELAAESGLTEAQIGQVVATASPGLFR
ncbi:hypothetical protein ACFVUY_38105 [Kitasatospora sp. NPDC058063]|uniref:hypothetical protein n=1 Tax=unclassified Kitasatospora TaxID=2633591 RepID=UPI0036DEE4D7